MPFDRCAPTLGEEVDRQDLREPETMVDGVSSVRT
jgi:hypothetical protein